MTIGNGVTSIGEKAFDHCTSLTTVIMGKNVESIGYGAFYECKKLASVYITDLSAWCNIDFAFNEYEYHLYSNPLAHSGKLYLNDEELTELVVPKDIKEIKRGTFYRCSSIAKVTIGDELEIIWDEPFSGCSSLTEVVIGKKVKQIGEYAFYGAPVAKCYSYATRPPSLINSYHYPTFTPTTESVLYVPKGCISKYAASDGWNKFKNIEAME